MHISLFFYRIWYTDLFKFSHNTPITFTIRFAAQLTLAMGLENKTKSITPRKTKRKKRKRSWCLSWDKDRDCISFTRRQYSTEYRHNRHSALVLTHYVGLIIIKWHSNKQLTHNRRLMPVSLSCVRKVFMHALSVQTRILRDRQLLTGYRDSSASRLKIAKAIR